jgi:hypothetical protein
MVNMIGSHLNSKLLAGTLIAATIVFSIGCGGTAFNLSYPDNTLAAVKTAASQIKTQGFSGRNRVYIVTRKPQKIVAWNLQTQKADWSVAAAVRSRIVIGAQLIFHADGSSIVARRAENGSIAWRVATRKSERLLGLATDGDRLYVATEAVSRLQGDGAAAYLAAFSSAGVKRWRRPSGGRLGAPAARNGLVFVPLRYQSIAVLSEKDGFEIARIRSEQEVLLWVRSTPTGVFFGGKTGVYRFDEKAIAGKREGSTFVAAALPESVRPAYWWNGYNAALSRYTAYDRNRLLWHLEGADNPRFLGDTVFVHNYRFFFAFEGAMARRGADRLASRDSGSRAKKGRILPPTQSKRVADRVKKAAQQGVKEAGKEKKDKASGFERGQIDVPDDSETAIAPRLRWAYSFPRIDVVASYHTGKALVLVSVRGDIVVLDLATGRPINKTSLKTHVAGATFDALGYRPSGSPKGKANLEKALTEMIWDPDRRFGAVKLFGIQQLARLSGHRVAEALVQVVTRPGINAKVYRRAGEMIVSRRDKKAIPLYLKVLRRRYNFLDGTEPRAVDIMARALGDLRAPEAVKPLLLHLADPETRLPAVVAIVQALHSIGDSSVVEPLRDFLLTYRCEPQFRKVPAALNAVADALLGLGGEEERQLLRFVGNDSHSLESLRVYIKTALRQDKEKRRSSKGRRAAGR